MANVVQSDEGGQTTYRIAAECVNAGHEVWVMSPGGLAYEPDDRVRALARAAPAGHYGTSQAYLEALNSPEGRRTAWVTVDDLDVLLLRSNPSVQSVWAQSAGIGFGRIAMRHGVIVLNDPNGLAKASTKLYLQTLPEEVRPRTLVTRNSERLKSWATDMGTVVLKPLLGSGGRNVFVVRENDLANVDEMIRAVARDGYVIAQEYLPAAVEGDTRFFLMNGRPLVHRGRYAAFRRIRSGGDLRSNIHAGGRLRRARVDDSMLRIAEMVRPRIVEDGMFLVGLDIVGDKILEVNVFSPGGLGSAQLFEKANFARAVVNALERKVDYMRYYRRNFSNVEMATL